MEKFVKTPERNTSGYLSCNVDRVLQFYRISIRCCSHIWLVGLYAGLQLVVPKKPLHISWGHRCNRWCNSLFSCSGKVVSLKTTIPLHTGIHSVTTQDVKNFARLMPKSSRQTITSQASRAMPVSPATSLGATKHIPVCGLIQEQMFLQHLPSSTETSLQSQDCSCAAAFSLRP